MILVLLGTQNNNFNRLLKEIEKLVKKGSIKEEVVIQAGYTKYQTEGENEKEKENANIKILDFISKEEVEELQQKANLIITHGGVGSIIQSISKGKKVIAVPRLHKYGEHVNDHQKEIVQAFNERGYILGIQEVEALEQAIQQIKEFKPKPYQSNNQKLLEIVEKAIGDVS